MCSVCLASWIALVPISSTENKTKQNKQTNKQKSNEQKQSKKKIKLSAREEIDEKIYNN
jgi:predicted membrane protein